MSSQNLVVPPCSSRQPTSVTTHRPPSVEELSNRARHTLGNPSRSLNEWVHAEQILWAAGLGYMYAGDLEAAYVELAQAAIILNEKIPAHPHYPYYLLQIQYYHIYSVSIIHRIYPVVRFFIITMMLLLYCLYWHPPPRLSCRRHPFR